MGSKPKEIPYELLGSSDPFMTWIHRITSVNFFLRKVYEAIQYGWLEDIFTICYSWYLRKTSGKIKKRLLEIIDAHPEVDSIVVVATHFGLAHQIGAIKGYIKKLRKVDIVLAVQVTDDTSQHIWCVRGADITFVPSRQTRNELTVWAKSRKIRFNCEVSPYPVSKELCVGFSGEGDTRCKALGRESNEPINVVVPISGAAVGLDYLSSFLMNLDRMCGRFRFYVVSKRSSHTQKFLTKIGKLRWVQIVTGRNDNEVVRLYEKLYIDNMIHMEVTKPSEQAFKALIHPKFRGGCLILFSKPIGRQEYDNLSFLERHKLIYRFRAVETIAEQALPPRGILLSENPEDASRMVLQMIEIGLAKKMVCEFEFSPASMMTSEVSEKGAWLFWEKLRLLKYI